MSRWIDQTRTRDTHPDVRGDCTRAAIASLFALPLDAVPDFDADDPVAFYEGVETFFLSLGYEMVRLDGDVALDALHLANGTAARGVPHTVVRRGSAVVHDPHPSRAGLDGVDFVVAPVPLDPSRLLLAQVYRERLRAIVDWADLAHSASHEFADHGLGLLRGPVFDEAREVLVSSAPPDRGEGAALSGVEEIAEAVYEVDGIRPGGLSWLELRDSAKTSDYHRHARSVVLEHATAIRARLAARGAAPEGSAADKITAGLDDVAAGRFDVVRVPGVEKPLCKAPYGVCVYVDGCGSLACRHVATLTTADAGRDHIGGLTEMVGETARAPAQGAAADGLLDKLLAALREIRTLAADQQRLPRTIVREISAVAANAIIAAEIDALAAPSSDRGGATGIYMASKAVHGPRWRKLRDAGWPIISTWIDEAEAGRTTNWAGLWDRCVAEPAQAAVTVLYAEEFETLKGALVEVGAALSHGRRVIVVGPVDFTWMRHRNVHCVGTLLEARRLAESWINDARQITPVSGAQP